MATYSTSVATKNALIMAAGELFAKHGFKAVSVREIVKKAGENIGAIKYHFGGKDGLLEAAIDYATEDWQRDPMGSYLKQNAKLFDTVDGQRKLVCGIIDIFMDMIFMKEKPEWCGALLFQVVHQDIFVCKKIYESCSVPTIKAFHSLYKRITGNGDQQRAFCWMAMTFSPTIRVLSTNSQQHANPLQPIQDSTRAIMHEMTERSALVNLGLWKPSLEKRLSSTAKSHSIAHSES